MRWWTTLAFVIFTLARLMETEANDAVRFVIPTQDVGNVLRIDFTFQVRSLETGAPSPESGAMGGFMPVRFGESNGYYGWGDGRWRALFAKEERLPPF